METNQSKNINTKEKKEKIFKYCEKCGKQLEEGSVEHFCCWECKKDFYKELAQDMDDIVGIN